MDITCKSGSDLIKHFGPSSKSFADTVYQATLWTHVEPSVGLICSCLPMIRSLIPVRVFRSSAQSRSSKATLEKSWIAPFNRNQRPRTGSELLEEGFDMDYVCMIRPSSNPDRGHTKDSEAMSQSTEQSKSGWEGTPGHQGGIRVQTDISIGVQEEPVRLGKA